MTNGYSADALIFDEDEGTWSLRPDYDPGIHRVKFVWDDDDTYLDGDWSADERGQDTGQNVLITTIAGTQVASGQVYDEDYFRISAGDGPVIDLDRLEIGGRHVGYVVTQPLRPAETYSVVSYGNVTSDSALRYSQFADVMCFGPATLISTDAGDLPVDRLVSGDLVITRDRGARPLRWIGRFHLTAKQLAANPNLRPVTIGADGLAGARPARPLVLSPQHRVLLCGADLLLHFGFAEAFAAAKHLAAPAPRRTGACAGGFTYFHLLFDDHHVLRANGLWCESLFAGAGAGPIARLAGSRPPPHIRHAFTARPCLSGWESRLIAGLRGLPGVDATCQEPLAA